MKTQYITDTKGRKVSVILPLRDYNKMIEELEELADIRAYDEAKASDEESIPFELAIKEIEAKRHDLRD
jgi:PHD/YefM family antitoxin component YafN of YafNO toxin-antitoxin module